MISIDGSEIRAFADQLRDFPREFRPRLRREIRKAAGGLVREIQQNASWSSRIPGATRVSVGFGQRSAGVTVLVDEKKAPHARPLEFGNRAGGTINRHPVFGGDMWVEQPTRPFFMRAVRSAEKDAVTAVQTAIDEAFARF